MDENTKIIAIMESNEIHIPFEWLVSLEFGMGYVQISLVDDRIVIHKTIAADIKYTSPCKVSDNSYVRSLRLFSVTVPKQLLEQLDINKGDRVDLTLEENCISIRKNIDVEQEPEITHPTEPIMTFCCVCGKLLYTQNGLVKVSATKYICRDCIEIVKAL